MPNLIYYTGSIITVCDLVCPHTSLRSWGLFPGDEGFFVEGKGGLILSKSSHSSGEGWLGFSPLIRYTSLWNFLFCIGNGRLDYLRPYWANYTWSCYCNHFLYVGIVSATHKPSQRRNSKSIYMIMTLLSGSSHCHIQNQVKPHMVIATNNLQTHVQCDHVNELAGYYLGLLCAWLLLA